MGFLSSKGSDVCFHCHDPIVGVAIQWSGEAMVLPDSDAPSPRFSKGETVWIWFHIECANAFLLRFARDVYELAATPSRIHPAENPSVLTETIAHNHSQLDEGFVLAALPRPRGRR